jgi:hypothetical protein
MPEVVRLVCLGVGCVLFNAKLGIHHVQVYQVLEVLCKCHGQIRT